MYIYSSYPCNTYHVTTVSTVAKWIGYSYVAT